MKLSAAAELAVRGILVLAEEYGKGPTTLDTVCRRRELPKQYLVKIFSSLSKADLITPIRGKKGGYLLARDPGDISILDVVEAVEGPIALNLCQHEIPKCDEEDCRVRPVWSRLQDAVKSQLGALSLAECVNGHAAGGHKAEA